MNELRSILGSLHSLADLLTSDLAIFGPVQVSDAFRNQYSELYELLNDLDVVQRINIVVRMEEDAPARRVFDEGIYGSRRRGRTYIRWKDQIEEALVCPTAEALGSMCCRRSKPVSRVVMTI